MTFESAGSSALTGVLWDMDGTLVDSEPFWHRAEQAMFDRFGVEMPPGTHQQLIGSGLWNAAELCRTLGIPLSAEAIVSEWVADVAADLDRSAPEWCPGAVALLSSLQQEGIACALVTMSVRSLADTITSLLPVDSFQIIIAGDEVTHPKPHPEPYLLAAAALGITIGHCVALEDSPTGLRSAYASGAIAIGVPNLLPLDAEPAHAIIPTLEGVHAGTLRDIYAAARTSGATPRLS